MLIAGPLIQGPIFIGCVPYPLFKKPAEMLRVFEPKGISYFADGFGGVENFFFSYVNDFLLDVLLWRFTRLFFDEISEVVGG